MRIQNTPSSYGLLAGLLVFLLGLLANASCACTPRLALAQLHDEYDAAVKIEAHCVVEKDGVFSMSGWYGSGVVVDQRHVLTAGHVATADEHEICSFVATDSAGTKRIIAPLVIDAKLDLASMRLQDDQPDFAPTHVHFGIKPLRGSIVCASPAFPRSAHKCGEVQPYVEAPGDIVMGIIVEPGNSGSALYDEYGHLVGIVTHLLYCQNHQWCAGKAASLQDHVKALLP